MYLRVAKRVNLVFSHHEGEIVTMWYYAGVSQWCGGNHSATCKCIKSTHCIPWTYTVLCVNYSLTNLKEKYKRTPQWAV